jgi:hypothetical protein
MENEPDFPHVKAAAWALLATVLFRKRGWQ